VQIDSAQTSNEAPSSLYESLFERHFLSKSTQYYREEAVVVARESDVSGFMKKSMSRMSEELDRLRHCLPEASHDKVLPIGVPGASPILHMRVQATSGFHSAYIAMFENMMVDAFEGMVATESYEGAYRLCASLYSSNSVCRLLESAYSAQQNRRTAPPA
jgi:hypothetical protein